MPKKEKKKNQTSILTTQLHFQSSEFKAERFKNIKDKAKRTEEPKSKHHDNARPSVVPDRRRPVFVVDAGVSAIRDANLLALKLWTVMTLHEVLFLVGVGVCFGGS